MEFNLPYPLTRGLAAVMDARDRIAEVTCDYIAIGRPRATAVPLVEWFRGTDSRRGCSEVSNRRGADGT
jgi:hypothetical protein